jgi:hydrogenase-1 operon protein HyaF
MLDKHLDIASETAEPVSPYDDPECSYVAMPAAMQTFAAPSLYDIPLEADGDKVLEQLQQGLAACLQGESGNTIDLLQYDSPTVKFVRESLGTGEISVLADLPDRRVMMDEAVFTGGRGALLPCAFPDGVMNAPALLHELFAKSAAFSAGSVEVVNLTLLPLSPEDNALLVETLGLAGLSILSRGYGDCRISLTRLPHVWWVQYFNSSEQLILNTLEITDLPQVALAAREDLEDTLERLQAMQAELGTVNN